MTLFWDFFVGEITPNFSLNPSTNQEYQINMNIYMQAFKVTFGWAVLYTLLHYWQWTMDFLPTKHAPEEFVPEWYLKLG